MKNFSRRNFIKYTSACLPGLLFSNPVLAFFAQQPSETVRLRRFIEAARVGNLFEVQTLLNAGIAVDSCLPSASWDQFHESALHVACREDHYHVVEFLLKNGAVVDNWGTGFFKQTPIFFARSLNVTKLLVEAGADINAVDSGESCTVLTSHHYEKDYPIFKFLLDSGADFEAQSSCGNSALRCTVSWYGGFSQMEELFKRGASLGGGSPKIL